MTSYNISISPAGDEIHLLLRGPGIDDSGRRYIFANTQRCAAFAEAVNFAYEQGLREGWRRSVECDDRVLVVSGRNPDDLRLRPERWWERLRRTTLLRRRG